MKINWLYICLILAIATLYMIKNRVQNQSLNNYFGTAEAESIIIKSELSGQLVDIRPKAGQLIKKGDKDGDKKEAKKGDKKTLVLLDSHAIIHRAYHALPDFASSTGAPTGALYGLSTMLMGILEKF